MLYKKNENPEGAYQDKDGTRCDLLECSEAFGPQAGTFLSLPDMATAMAYFSLEAV